MLFDDTTAIDGHDIAIGEGFADEAERLGIVVGLIGSFLSVNKYLRWRR